MPRVFRETFGRCQWHGQETVPQRRIMTGGRARPGGRRLNGISTADHHAQVSHRHRPRHHQQRPGVHRSAARKPRRPAPEIQTFAVPQLVAPGEIGRAAAAAVVPLPAGPARSAAPAPTALPWDAEPRLRRRRVRPQPRRHGAGPAGHLRQVVAVPCRRRSLRRRCCPGAPRRTCRASRRSRPRPATCGTWSRLELRDGARTGRTIGWRNRRSC